MGSSRTCWVGNPAVPSPRPAEVTVALALFLGITRAPRAGARRAAWGGLGVFGARAPLRVEKRGLPGCWHLGGLQWVRMRPQGREP